MQLTLDSSGPRLSGAVMPESVGSNTTTHVPGGSLMFGRVHLDNAGSPIPQIIELWYRNGTNLR